MRPSLANIALVLALSSPGLPAAAQGRGEDAVRLLGRGADLRILRAGSEIAVETPLENGDEIRTGPSSFVQLAAGSARLTMGPGGALTLVSTGLPPAVRLDAGTLGVATRLDSVRIQSLAGEFELSGRSGEASFEVGASRLAVQVRSGELTADRVDSDALVLKGAEERASRVWTAGFTEGFKPSAPRNPGWFPNVLVPYSGGRPFDYPPLRVPRPRVP